LQEKSHLGPARVDPQRLLLHGAFLLTLLKKIPVIRIEKFVSKI
jgi:hypothetical protein